MTREELQARIAELRKAAEGLEEPFTLNDINRLEMRLAGLSLDDITARLAAIELPEVGHIDQAIAAAREASAERAAQVAALDRALALLARAVGLVL